METLLNQTFNSSKDALDTCQDFCSKHGFQMKSESAQNSMRVMIYHDQQEKQSISLAQSSASEWILLPQQIQYRIDQLLAENPSRADIQDIIQLEFPDYKGDLPISAKIAGRIQKLIMASTRLCSVVAANEDWASCVENDLLRMVENYRQSFKLPQQALDELVDLNPMAIYSNIDHTTTQKASAVTRRSAGKNEALPLKHRQKSLSRKRKTTMLPSEHLSVAIPDCTMYVRSQPLRSLSEPSSQQSSRRAFQDLMAAIPQPTNPNSPTAQAPPPPNVMTTGAFGHVFNLASPISPSSSSSIHQRLDFSGYKHHESMLQSPPIPDSMMMGHPHPSHYSAARTFSLPQQNTHYTSDMTNSTSTNSPSSTTLSNGPSVNEVPFTFDTNPNYQPMMVVPSRPPQQVASNHSHYDQSMYYSQTNLQQQQQQQQRMMVQQQDYEQRQLLEQQTHSHVHLPMIRNHFYSQTATQQNQSWS
ncbi:hypothetical protein BD560DRAFT_445526 [Blakeslea trispora]|nr:hypothetical protein BD560DRAFT_445526 [Blakeslea trispora]